METNQGKKAINIVYTVVTAESISRYEILSWVNKTLGTDLSKVEELCTGAIYCRLVDHLFGPGTLQLKRVKFQTHLENDYFQNFKLLQVAFNNFGVDKAIPIEKLIKGRYNDNYEFAQWFKMFYDANYGGRTDVPKPLPADVWKGAKPRNEEHNTKVTYPTEAERQRKLAFKTKQAEVLRRPATAAPAVSIHVQEPDGKPLAANLPAQLRLVQRKVVELNTVVQNVVESMDEGFKEQMDAMAAAKEKDFYQTSLTDIKELCESEDAKESDNPEMAALLHRIFRILKREPHAGTNKSQGDAVAPTPEVLIKPELVAVYDRGCSPIPVEPKPTELLRPILEESTETGGDNINNKLGVEMTEEKVPNVDSFPDEMNKESVALSEDEW